MRQMSRKHSHQMFESSVRSIFPQPIWPITMQDSDTQAKTRPILHDDWSVRFLHDDWSVRLGENRYD